jgi:CRP-like cAMP-binding protein
MANAQPSWRENRLLARLPEATAEHFVKSLQPVSLDVKHIISKVGGPIEAVYFPTGGVISAMTIMDNGSAIEVATIGKEGMAGLPAILGNKRSPYEVMVQVSGHGLCMGADAFAAEASRPGPLRDVLVRYHNAFLAQVSYSVACNGLHQIEQRCCRWLLMTQDRVGSDTLQLTHEFLGIMLGVRRASVTDVLSALAEQGAIRNGRAEIEIVNRARLEELSCECYRRVLEQYDQAFD